MEWSVYRRGCRHHTDCNVLLLVLVRTSMLSLSVVLDRCLGISEYRFDVSLSISSMEMRYDSFLEFPDRSKDHKDPFISSLALMLRQQTNYLKSSTLALL